jgi:hypothetical protein
MSQIATKFIADNAVTGAKVRLSNAENLRGRNAGNTADINIFQVNSSNNIEFQAVPYALSSLPIPTAAKQFATIEYIQNYVVGKQQAKSAVNYLSNANVSGTFTAGSGGVAATLVGASQLVIDGKSFTGTDVTSPQMRIALTAQTAGLQNGVYTLTAATASSFTLQRAADFDSLSDPNGLEVAQGDYFFVISGTTYSGYEALLTTPNPITIDSTALVFSLYPTAISLTAGDMLSKTNNVFSVNLATTSGLYSSNPGVAGGQLAVRADTAALVQNQTTKVDTSTNAVLAKKPGKTIFTLAAADITNQYIDLSVVATTNSIRFSPVGAGYQYEGTDYSVNYTSGSGGNTRITFLGGLATGGTSALVSGDVLVVEYTSF